MSAKERCEGTRRDGTPCRARALADSGFCVSHDPDVRDLAPGVRAMLDVIGHHAAERGLNQDGTSNRLGRELDELAQALELGE